MPINPFRWTGPIDDYVSRQPFTKRIALTLKGGTHAALFGPRGTGKTTFLTELAGELEREQEPDAPPWHLIAIDLRRAISLPAFVGAVSDALERHPDRGLRRRGRAAFGRLEKEMQINLGVVKAGARTTSRRELNESEILHRQLRALMEISPRLVIAFDEFQRLDSCPGEPLSIIRSALMGADNTGNLTLLLTGSLRERLDLMLHNDTEPIWDQTLDLELPSLSSAEFADYLQDRFAASGHAIDDRAVEQLLELTEGHPKRTQHLAWHVWDRAQPDEDLNSDVVQEAFDGLVGPGSQTPDFARPIDTLLSGSDADVNEARAMFLIATGEAPGSRKAVARYGFSGPDASRRALERLRERGLVAHDDRGWRVVDPLLAEWLRRNDPLRFGG
jgi:energy-coupling factor transporter ATP-binding protein EcfA2